MTKRNVINLLIICAFAPCVLAATAQALTDGVDVRVTRDDTPGSYARLGGGTDPILEGCSTGLRQQVEPPVAISPRNPSVIVAGAIDRCRLVAAPDPEVGGWDGYYRSTDGGRTWQDGLLPGYPGDTSDEGMASPVHGLCRSNGDPIMTFDSEGRLFYAFQCFNSIDPPDLKFFVATFEDDGADYVRTVLLPDPVGDSALHPPLWNDKPAIAVDRTGGRFDGRVYVAGQLWYEPANLTLVWRSADHGQTFSPPVLIAPPTVLPPVAGVAFAVGPDGTVYLAFRSIGFPYLPDHAIWLTRSVDGGRSFSPPLVVAIIEPLESSEFTGEPGPLPSFGRMRKPYIKSWETSWFGAVSDGRWSIVTRRFRWRRPSARSSPCKSRSTRSV